MLLDWCWKLLDALLDCWTVGKEICVQLNDF